MAWKDAEVRQLARHFIPAADEVGRLESATDLPGQTRTRVPARLVSICMEYGLTRSELLNRYSRIRKVFEERIEFLRNTNLI